MSHHEPARQGWQPLSTVESGLFTEARLQVHWAAQVIAAIANTHLEQAKDDSQSNLGWVDGMQILAGRYLDGEPSGFGSLTPATLQLAFHEPGGEVLQAIELPGRTLDQAYAAMEAAIAARLGTAPRTLVRPDYDLPGHPVADGAKFAGAAPAALAALQDWVHDANLVLRDLRARTAQATMPRVWPHHLDMGMLVSLEPSGDPAEGRSIGIGWSPGDDQDPAPYWYVNPYPSPPKVDGLASPWIGRWNTEGFVGLKLDAAETIGDGSGQEARARRFVDEAVAICRGVLGATPKGS